MAVGLPAGRTAALSLAPALLLLAALSFAGAIAVGEALAVAAAMIAGVVWLVRSPRPAHVSSRPQPAAPAAVSQEFLERLPDPVIVLNARREIVAVNRPAREIFGVGPLGRDLALSLRHPEVLTAVEMVTAGLSPVTQEITLPAPVPRTFTLHAGMLDLDVPHPGPVHAERGPRRDLPDDAAMQRVVLVLRDETRAKRAERSRVDFITNASHELRSPLSALIGFIETLRGPASEDAAARDRFLGIMQAEAQRMARLVEDLMSLSRVEINEHVPPRHRVDLADVLAAVTEALAGRAEKRQMTIVLECPDLPPVLGETDQLTQVFHNLVDNAIKYGRAGTPIGITASVVERLPGTQAAGVRIAVTDVGDGIEAIHLPRLTERFYRADEGRSRRLGGTGLGLAIAKHIVNRHRGRLTIDSQVGKGSTFTVLLPALPLPAAAEDGGPRAADGPAGVIKP